VIVRGANGYAVMVAAAPSTLLLVVASRDAKLGLLFLDMGRAVAAIRKVL
jgi:predicted regulator of Ras-like GTPase activity (Roadblock/LC7/MglB family)